MNKQELAAGYYSKGYNCAQSVMAAFWPELNLNEEVCVKATSAFGKGMYIGSTCGAVSGAVLVIGFKYGSFNINDKAAQKKVIKMTKEFLDKFNQRNTSIMCNELLKIKKEGAAENIVAIYGPNTNRCAMLVIDAVGILEDTFHTEE